jgi:hypothetical protein
MFHCFGANRFRSGRHHVSNQRENPSDDFPLNEIVMNGADRWSGLLLGPIAVLDLAIYGHFDKCRARNAKEGATAFRKTCDREGGG